MNIQYCDISTFKSCLNHLMNFCWTLLKLNWNIYAFKKNIFLLLLKKICLCLLRIRYYTFLYIHCFSPCFSVCFSVCISFFLFSVCFSFYSAQVFSHFFKSIHLQVFWSSLLQYLKGTRDIKRNTLILCRYATCIKIWRKRFCALMKRN